MRNKIIPFLLASMVLLAPVLAATITTSVRFLIPTDTSFSLATPASNSSVSSGSGDAIIFNTTSTTATKLNASLVTGGSPQSDTVAQFRYTNDGNLALNLTQTLNQTVNSCVVVKVGLADGGYTSSCALDSLAGGTNTTACANLSTSAVQVANLSANGVTEDVWMWADFTACTAGMDVTVTDTHTSASGV